MADVLCEDKEPGGVVDGWGQDADVNGGDGEMRRTATGCENWLRNDNPITRCIITGWMGQRRPTYRTGRPTVHVHGVYPRIPHDRFWAHASGGTMQSQGIELAYAVERATVKVDKKRI